MTMNAIITRLLLVLCLGMLGACSRDTRGTTVHANPATAMATSTTRADAAPGDSNVYPYDLRMFSSVYRVDREADAARLRLELIRWSDGPNGGKDALFRVRNPGDRPVLVWNVRQQVRAPHSAGAAQTWETEQNDYPGRGWENSVIPAGGSVQFPMPSPGEDDWRVCLLYSRETPDSTAPKRRFGGTYETIGPSVREGAREH